MMMMRSYLILILGFLCNRGALARSCSCQITELHFGPTAEELCVDTGLDDEASCNNAHVDAPSELSPEFYGDPRPVHCCEWKENKCTYGTKKPDTYCSMGKPSSKDWLYISYMYIRELGSQFSASATAVRIAVQVILKVVGLASLIGSSYIIYNLAGSRAKIERNLTKQPRSKVNVVFNRLFVALSISDAIASFMFFLSSWVIPDYDAHDPVVLEGAFSEELYYRMFPWASGNMITCHIQGAVLYFAQVMSVWFTGAISLQYVLTVTYEWQKDRMAIFEKIVFVWTLLYAVTTTIAIGATNSLGVTTMGYCWIASTPWYCDQLGVYCGSAYSDFDPEQYNTVWAFRMSALAVTALNFIVIIVSMVILFCTVRRQEKRAAQWSHTAAQGNAQKKVIYKAILLIGVYLVVYFPSFVSFWLEYYYPQYISVAMALTIPCQGFFNALIYSDKKTTLGSTRTSSRLSSFKSRMSGWTKWMSKSYRTRRSEKADKSKRSSIASSTIASTRAPSSTMHMSTLSMALDVEDEGEANPPADPIAVREEDPTADPSTAREEEDLVVAESGLKHKENTSE